ncbi:MAG: hypothetical protein CMJ19_19410 [Phycisphaeraceae bacterium]|nr:hypothetical protein [Phycisphaeraceae bacterium]
MRRIHCVKTVLLTLFFAYAIPLFVYAMWAWSRLRSQTWIDDTPPEIDPLGYAWQYWKPTLSNGVGGSSYWAAIEQGERWWWVMVIAAGVIVGSFIFVLFERFVITKTKAV